MNDRQLAWAATFVALVQRMAAAKSAAAAAAAALAAEPDDTPEASPREPAEAATPRVPVLVVPAATPGGSVASPVSGSFRVPRPETKALGVFGKVWDFMIDEAAYIDTTEGELRLAGGPTCPPDPSGWGHTEATLPPHSRPCPASPRSAGPLALTAPCLMCLLPACPAGASPRPRPSVPALPLPGPEDDKGWEEVQAVPMHAELTLRLQQLDLELAVVQERHPTLAGSAPGSSQQLGDLGSEAGGAAQQPRSRAASLSQTLQQLHHVTSLEHALRLQQQLSVALREEGAAEELGAAGQQQLRARQAAVVVHAFARLSLAELAVTVASVDARMRAVVVQLRACSLEQNASAAEVAPQQLLLAHAQPASAEGPSPDPAPDCWLEVLELQAAEQSPAPGEDQDQAAASVKWLGPDVDRETSPQRCLAIVGVLRATLPAGFITTLVLFAERAQLATPAGPGSTEVQQQQQQPGQPATAGGPDERQKQPQLQQEWMGQLLAGEVVMECTVAAIQLALRSSQAQGAAAVVLALRQLQCQAGEVHWGATWNQPLREALLAPPGAGFAGGGLRLSLDDVSLAVARDGGAGPSHWEAAAGVSSSLEVHGLLAASPFDPSAPAAPSAAGALPPPAAGPVASLPPWLASVALSPIQLQLSGDQLAAVVGTVAALEAEVQRRFRAPLVPDPHVGPGAAPWLAGASLSVSAVHAAYAAPGSSVGMWTNASGSVTVAGSAGGGRPTPGQLYVGLSSLVLAAAVAPGEAAGSQVAVAKLQLGQPHAWLLPGVQAALPLADLCVGTATRASWDGGAASLVGQPPAAMLAGVEFAALPARSLGQAGRQSEQQGGRQEEQLCGHLSSLVVSLPPLNYRLLCQLLSCLAQQPALPPAARFLPARGITPPPRAAGSTPAPGPPSPRSEPAKQLLLRVDAASCTLWPDRQHGIAVWLAACDLDHRPAAGGSSSLHAALGSLHAALLEQQADGALPCTAPVLRLAASPQAAREQPQPALSLALTTAPAQPSLPRELQRWQVAALPLDLAITPLLLRMVSRVAADFAGGSSQAPAADAPEGALPPPPPPPQPAHEQHQQQRHAQQAQQMHARLSLQRLGVRLCQHVQWDQGDAPPLAAHAAHLRVEESVVVIHQQLAAENRPWLADASNAAAALLTSVDGTLMGSELVVSHAGEPYCVLPGPWHPT